MKEREREGVGVFRLHTSPRLSVLVQKQELDLRVISSTTSFPLGATDKLWTQKFLNGVDTEVPIYSLVDTAETDFMYTHTRCHTLFFFSLFLLSHSIYELSKRSKNSRKNLHTIPNQYVARHTLKTDAALRPPACLCVFFLARNRTKTKRRKCKNMERRRGKNPYILRRSEKTFQPHARLRTRARCR
jgi:hypothetical protein